MYSLDLFPERSCRARSIEFRRVIHTYASSKSYVMCVFDGLTIDCGKDISDGKISKTAFIEFFILNLFILGMLGNHGGFSTMNV
jgi:hypothetical protein